MGGVPANSIKVLTLFVFLPAICTYEQMLVEKYIFDAILWFLS